MDKNKIAAMRQGGAHLGRIRRHLMGLVKPDLDLIDLENVAQKMIREIGATPNFATVSNYGFATCLMINDEVVHCKPRHQKIKLGDLVTIDIGLEWQGWNLDSADSCLAGKPDDTFVSVGRQALKKAIAAATPGHTIGHISRAMQQIIQKNGYSPIVQYCGHGIGKHLHEDPQIPCLASEPITKTPLIQENMTLAIEVMMNEGRSEVIIDSDGWRAHTVDGSRSAQFEHTVLVTSGTPIVLTA